MDQSFECECKSSVSTLVSSCEHKLSRFQRCLGKIQGAKYLSKTELETQQWVNPWIWQLVSERDIEVHEGANNTTGSWSRTCTIF